ncbi:cuticle protein 2-like [Bacillus rossius redtenbacheri]|uniref:cuticle protein 2-like n=1 Tax=Bacillus rossius redtenbacheri TaxID=93214 RepID=UPI002FDDAEEC
MKVLIVLAAVVALAAARPSWLGLGGWPYLGAPHASVAIAPPLAAPLPVTDTPEVAQARAEHLAAVAKAAAAPAAPAAPAAAPLVAPEPVTDTPEVALARAQHLAAVAGAAVAPGLLHPGLHGGFAYSSVAPAYHGYPGWAAGGWW